MRFSILVPVYNVEEYLEQCVESLLSQTYEDYEIILVDDGSTDSSGRICDRYAENHPEKIKAVHKMNEGLVSAREHGIKNAAGEYCLFVDSDDFVEKNLLEAVEACLAANADTDMVIYSFNYYRNGQKSARSKTLAQKETVFQGKEKNGLYEALISTPLITALWIKAVKTEILKKDSTDYSLYYDKNMAEDMFRSVYLVTAAEKIVYINEPLYNYRTNDVGISRSYRPQTIPKKNILYVYDRFRDYLPKWGLDDREHRQKLNARWLNEAMYTFSQYYENASASAERKAVLRYDWGLMLPEEAKTDISEYENKSYRRLYEWLGKKQFCRIRLYFLKKKLIKRIRLLKARLLKK